jgi:hypothetical protein
MIYYIKLCRIFDNIFRAPCRFHLKVTPRSMHRKIEVACLKLTIVINKNRVISFTCDLSKKMHGNLFL